MLKQYCPATPALLLAASTLVQLPAPALAQTPADTFRLPELVVTATKVASPRAAVPAHVTVLSGTELQAQGITRVVDALRAQPGLAVVQLGPPGAVASVFLRGGESDYVQVLVDGVQVNDPGGAYDWAHLTTADIDRIEIVRGPASVLYGSDAVSGVVQVFTRGGRGDRRVQATASTGVARRVGARASGRYRTWTSGASVTGGGQATSALDLSYGLGASSQHSDGAYAFNNGYGNTTLSGRLRFAHTAGTTVNASLHYTDQQYHYPTDGAGNVVDRNRYTGGQALSAGLGLLRPLGAHSTALLTFGFYRNDTGANDPEDEPGGEVSASTSRVSRDQLELRLDSRPSPGLTLSVGGELKRQHGASDYRSDGPFGPYSSASDDGRDNRAAYAQVMRAGTHLSLTAGARVDRSDQFGRFTTGRAGLSWQLARALGVHASWGTGFKEPTFVEAYATGFARGNPGLRPERSASTELGLRADAGGLQLEATAFRQTFRNLIQYTFAPPAADAPNYYNMGGANAGGVELEAAVSLPCGVVAGAGYTGLRTEVTDAGFGEDRQFLDGKPLLRRPAHHLTGALSWRDGPVTAALQAAYIGTRSDLDFTDPAEWQGRRVELKPYSTVDVSLGYALGAVELDLRADNLLGTQYQEVYNFPAPGRLLTLGVRATR